MKGDKAFGAVHDGFLGGARLPVEHALRLGRDEALLVAEVWCDHALAWTEEREGAQHEVWQLAGGHLAGMPTKPCPKRSRDVCHPHGFVTRDKALTSSPRREHGANVR
jgi:hypothetical protein